MTTTQTPPCDVTIPTPDGLRLRGWHWTRPSPRGVLLVAHGFGEHGGCYRHVAEALGPALEIDLVAPDMRGHGRSPGRRGVVDRYDDLLSDLRAMLGWVEAALPGVPLFVLGHSNGGLLTLRMALEGADGVAGVILSNPSLKIAVDVPRHKVWLGKQLLRYAPGVTLSGRVGPALMTRDPVMQRERERDPIRHNRISPPLYFGMAGGGARIAVEAGEIRAPLLMILGGADPVIDSRFSRQIFERLGSPDKTLIVYPEMLHEPLNELGREQVFADIIGWLAPRLDPGE